MATKRDFVINYGLQTDRTGTSTGNTLYVDQTNDRVGIGQATPGYKLDVSGDLNFTGSLYQNGSQYFASRWTLTGSDIYRLSKVGINESNPQSQLAVKGYITESTDNGTNYWNVVTQQDIGTNANQVPLNQYLGKLAFLDDFSPNGLRRENGSSDDVIVNSSGNVGIGTGSTTLTTKFHVLGSGVVARIESSTSNADIQLANSTSSSGYIQYFNTTLRFFANSGSTPTLSITGGSPGNVGIGVLTPTEQLEVAGRTVITTGAGPYYGLKVKDYSDSTGLYLGSVSGANSWYIGDSYYYNNLLWRTDKTAASSINFINGSVEFYTNSGLTAGVDFTPSRKVILDVNGNLLINRSSATGIASQPLQVNGGAYISSNLGINDTNPAGKSLALSVRINDTRYFGVVSASSAPVYRYDDNSVPTMLLQNYGMTAIGHGQGIVWQLGNSLTNGANAAGIYAQAETIWGSTGGSKNAYLSIQTTNSGSLNERVRITSVGDVGIGLSPAVPNDGDMTIGTPRLHVLGTENAGSYQLAARFQAGTDSDDTGSAILINHANDRGLLIEAGRKTGNQAVAYFGLVNNDGTNSRFLTAIEGGNVGVATTVPLQKLDVRGNFLLAADSTTATHITQKPYTINGGTISWEGSAGQLFSITNNLTSGSIFAVNDVSGIPSIDVDANGFVELAPFNGSVAIGTTTSLAAYKFNVNGTSRFRKTDLIASGSAWDDGLNLYSADATNRWNLLVDNGASDILRFAYNNAEAFQLNTSGNATFNGNVGIGAGPSATYKLDIQSTVNDVLSIKGGANATFMVFDNTTLDDYKIGGVTTVAPFVVYNNTDARYEMTFDGTGNVGIGTGSAAPSARLDVESSSALVTTFNCTSNGTYVRFENNGTSFGDVGSGGQLVTGGTTTDMVLHARSTGNIIFAHNFTERVRIDTSGNTTPAGDATQNLGSAAKRWANIYSADLQLSNEGSQNDVDGTWGKYTIQEGEENLYLINRRSGKKYKFVLQEV